MAWIGSSLRRLRDERASAIGAAVLVFVTAFAASAAPLLVARVADDTLHAILDRATPAAVAIQWIEEDRLASAASAPFASIEAASEAVHRNLPESIAGLVEEQAWTMESGRWRLPEVVGDPATMRLRVQPDAAERITLRDGRWPTGITTMGPDRTSADVPSPAVTFFEVAVPLATSDGLDVDVGDTLILASDAADPLVGRGRALTIGVEIVGIYEVDDEADPWWLGGTELARPSIRTLGGDARVTDTAGLLAPEAHVAFMAATRELGLLARYTFREYVDTGRLQADTTDAVVVDLRRLEAAYTSTRPTANQAVGLRTSLRATLETFRTQWGAASVILTVAGIGPAAVAIGALGLVAVLAAQRRRAALALARGRGASIGQVVGAVIAEGILITGPAAAAGVALAGAAIGGGSDPRSLTLSIVAGGAVAVTATIALLLATVPATSGPSFGGGRAPAPLRRPTSRRILLEGLVVVLAVGGAVLLRDRGVRGSSSAGALTAADPLIAAVPALIGIAAGLLAVRLFPLPIAALARLARRGRGLVPLVALRRSMHGTGSSAILVVLLGTATIAAFSSAVLVHLDRAAESVAWHEVGAAYRVESTTGSLASGFDPVSLPGAEAIAVASIAAITTGPRNLRVDFVTLAADDYDRVVTGTPADPDLPVDLFATSPGVIPLVVSAAAEGRADGLKIGEEFAVTLEGYTFPARVVAVRDDQPALSPTGLFVVASRDQIKAMFPNIPLLPSRAFVRAPDSAASDIRAAVAAAMPVGGRLTARAEVTRALRESPAGRAVALGVGLAAALAVVYAALAVAAALALAGAARAVEAAHLRTLGMTGRQAAALVVVEHGPAIVIATVVGFALGLGLVPVLRAGLGLDALVGSRVDVPVTPDLLQLAIVAGGTVVVVVLGLALGAWFQRGAAPTAAVRRGFE